VLDVTGGQGSSFAWTLGCFTIALGSLAALVGIRFMLYLAGVPDKKKPAVDYKED
jgi:hypothetical protein